MESTLAVGSLPLENIGVRPVSRAAPNWVSLRRLRTERWTVTHLLAALVMGALGVTATWDAWQEIFHLAARDEEYQHIFIVPLVAAWMVIVRRMRFRHCKPTGTGIGLCVALAGWGLGSFGYYRGYQTLWHAGAVLVVLGCILSVLGKQVIFRFFPALAVLIFLIPVPPYYRLKISVPLQNWTAQVSQVILEIFGVPVERAENSLSIRGNAVTIVEACNGLRDVFPLILVSYAFSFGLALRNSVRFILLLCSPLSAIFCNVVRILPTVYIYGYHSRAAGDVFHSYSGKLMLPISFLLLWGVIKVLRWAMIPVMRYSLVS